MGTAKKINCRVCGKKWTHYFGFGFSQVYYYCDKCGKKKTFKYEHGIVVDLSSEAGSCECGGTFRMDSDTIICPKCHNQVVEDEGDVNILWD